MAAESFNSIGGFSVGIPAVEVVDANGHVITDTANVANLTVTSDANLGNIAECCVFIKQSQPPFHCNPLQLHEQVASPTKGAPSPEVTVLICRVPSPGFSQAP